MAVEKGRKIHSNKSIKKMLATRKRNKLIKDKEMHEMRDVDPIDMKRKPPIRINLPGIITEARTGYSTRTQRIAIPAENLELLYGRLSQHLSAAETREIEEAIRILKLLDFIIEIASKKLGQ
jgi:hypothetical protein